MNTEIIDRVELVRKLQGRLDEYVNEHFVTDSETGVSEGGSRCEEYRNWLEEMIEEITNFPQTVKEDGLGLIAEERTRQVQAKGYDAAHDDGHDLGQLSMAAGCYLCVASAQTRGSTIEEWPSDMFDGFHDSVLDWPFLEEEYKPSENPIRNLVKAGAMIAAEIDRLKRYPKVKGLK